MAKRQPTSLPPGVDKSQPTEPPKPRDDDSQNTLPVRTPQVRAATCPANPKHTKTYVTSTQGATRFCKCRECDLTWKQIGPLATPIARTPCPNDPGHKNTRIHKWTPGTDHNICDDCGTEWKSPAPELPPEFAELEPKGTEPPEPQEEE